MADSVHSIFVSSCNNLVGCATTGPTGAAAFEPLNVDLGDSNIAWAAQHLEALRLACTVVGFSREDVAAVVSDAPLHMQSLVGAFDATGRHLAALTEVLAIARRRVAITLNAAGFGGAA